MPTYTFDPGLVFDDVTLAPARNLTGILLASADAVDPVPVYDMLGNPIEGLTTNNDGYVGRFKADIADGVMNFGGLLQPVSSIEQQRAGLTAQTDASTALAVAQQAQVDATNAVTTANEAKDLAMAPSTDAVDAHLGGPAAGLLDVNGIVTAAHLPEGFGGGARVVTMNVKDYGAVGDGVTDDSAAFIACVTAAKDAARIMPLSLAADPVGGVTIEVPNGDYLITQPGAMLGAEAMTTKCSGLQWRGEGQGMSNIIFQPATADSLMKNDYWLNVQVRDLGFYAATAGCTFFDSNTTHAGQAFQFFSCRFHKWKYGLYLRGNNNNSEASFYNCHTRGHQNDGAFLFVPNDSTASDQFLNYWFYACTHWSTSAPYIDMGRGGSVHIFGLDVSDYGTALTAPGKIVNLRGVAHANGVCAFECHGLRVEAKSTFAGILFSEWPQGNVTFDNTDFSSQVGSYTYGDIIDIRYVNFNGPHYVFRDSMLAGTVRVRWGTNDWSYDHKIVFENCKWYQIDTPSDVVVYDTSETTNTNCKPPVEFVRCLPPTGRSNVQDSTYGAAVWDCTIGFKGQLFQSLRERTLSIRGNPGVSTTQNAYFVLPIGAIITSMRVVVPAGTTSEINGADWTLATTEATPTTVMTLSVTDNMSTGTDTKVDAPAPFLCDTPERAKLHLSVANLGSPNTNALLLVNGYW